MQGIQIGKNRGGLWIALAVLAAAGSLMAAVLAGPRLMYVFSGTGALFAVVALFRAARARSVVRPVIFPAVMIGTHAVFLAAAVVLSGMFLSPLPDNLRKIPRLQRPYQDAGGIFELRGPVGWTYRPVPSAFESGVRMQPSDQAHYMGVSEVTVFVRRLESAPKSPEAFLEQAAASFSERKGGRKLFDLSTERDKSLGGSPVMWSMLTVKRFWVPLYQISVFGVKNGRYLCSVSATGLKSHAALSRILCLGLFERIKITEETGS